MTDLIVHFKKPADWVDTVYIHYWDTRPVSEGTTWPGVPMAAEADDWFVHRFDGVQAAHLVFNDVQGRRGGIGRAQVFLCGNAAASITGTAMPVDGGWVAQ